MRELTEVKSLEKYNWDELFNGSVWEITKEDWPEYKYLCEGWFRTARSIAQNRYGLKLSYRTKEWDGAGDPIVIWMKAIRN